VSNTDYPIFRIAFCVVETKTMIKSNHSPTESLFKAETRIKYLITPLVFVIGFLTGVNVCRDGSLPIWPEKATTVKKAVVPAAKDSNVAPGMDSKFTLAFNESLGFFDDIPNVDWQRYKKWSREQVDHRHPSAPQRSYTDAAKWYGNNFYPIFHCPQAKRIGGVGDGAKWVCDPHRLVTVAQQRKAAGEPGPHCIIYSVGSRGNYEFEDGIINEVGKICEIHVFDFSGDYGRPQNKAKNIHFHKWGLQASSQDRSKEGQFYTFPEILKQLGHEDKTIDIFKIDCEGCEWTTQQDWIDQDIRQVLIETHSVPKQWNVGLKYFQSYKQNQFAMFYREANVMIAAKCFEFSYVKLHPQFWNTSNVALSL
jgi:Methyltransferase domain